MYIVLSTNGLTILHIINNEILYALIEILLYRKKDRLFLHLRKWKSLFKQKKFLIHLSATIIAIGRVFKLVNNCNEQCS